MPQTELPPSATVADSAADRTRSRRATLITVSVLAGLVALIVLLTPVTDDTTDTTLTTQKYGPGNARLASELARRLGWDVRISDAPLARTLDTTAIYAVFDGPTPLTLDERNTILSAVRRGAGLLVAPATSTNFALLDSLGLRTGESGLVTATPLDSCPRETDPLSALRVRPRMVTFDSLTPRESRDSRWVPYPRGARTLLDSDVPRSGSGVFSGRVSGNSNIRDTNADSSSAATDSTRPRLRATPIASAAPNLQPTIVAFALGRGRVVALADPDILRTDQMRNCAMGSALSVVRSLEYLSDGRARRIVFSNHYQQSRNDGPSVVLNEWLGGTPPGRTVLTLMAAGILLLLARGRRTLAPVYRAREERRSALEHVDALATAWRAVRGTRTVAKMLARGIRRRHAAGRWRTLDDTAFLSALAERHPGIAADAARLSQAIESPEAPADLPALRRSAAQIDAACLTP